MSEKRRRGPPSIPQEERFKRWNVTLPPDLDLKLWLLLEDDSQASKSELLTKLLESHPTVMAVRLPSKT